MSLNLPAALDTADYKTMSLFWTWPWN